MTILQVMWSCSRHRQNILGSKVINDPSLHCACKRVLRGPLHCSRCHMERHPGAKWLVSPGGGVDGDGSPLISACVPHPSHYQSGERASPFIWFYSSFLGWDKEPLLLPSSAALAKWSAAHAAAKPRGRAGVLAARTTPLAPAK